MNSIRRGVKTAFMAVLLAATLSLAAPPAAIARDYDDGFDESYMFATTRAVSNMRNVNPALKLTIYPVTVVLDTAFLPFAVIAGFVA
jgi:uncharacterized protein YceK